MIKRLFQQHDRAPSAAFATAAGVCAAVRSHHETRKVSAGRNRLLPQRPADRESGHDRHVQIDERRIDSSIRSEAATSIPAGPELANRA